MASIFKITDLFVLGNPENDTFPTVTYVSHFLNEFVQNATIYNNEEFQSDEIDEIDHVSQVNLNQIQEYRKSVIRRECTDARRSGVKFQMGGKSSIYNDDYKIIFSALPKIASTTWKRVFLVLQGDVNSMDSLYHKDVQHKYHYPRLSSLSMSEVNIRMKTYTKVVFVREPFHRILSAYRNKLESDDDIIYRKRYGTTIIAKYRENPSSFSLRTGSDVTFLEFVKYLIDPDTSLWKMDMHWAPMFLLADVCNVNYDIIGKFEELQDDALYVLEKINATDLVKFPTYDTQATNSSRDYTYFYYYSTVPEELLSRLYDKYILDFKLFDYDKPLILKPSK
ncbi:carbohydrate sulfotransferase 11-like [Saccoglossus kowalevskii]|uniref:Carbohydrate sulfotransferase n=1 Tax=Saccoglossus kowalevskii TaxID=10224 RepID=A0ABM0GYP9_SACKO|nr:PREDICTED: carbohydrate sulfotransferase 14-like [Saccoglossus kowalevskii]